MHPINCCCEFCTAIIDELLTDDGEELETIITDTGDIVEISHRPRTWYWDGSAHVSRW